MSRRAVPIEAGTAVVALDGVTAVRGGVTVWTHGTFEVPAGAVVAVIGANGSGKTTLLELLLGLLAPAAGTIRVLGRSPTRGDRRIGYVPQAATTGPGDAVRCRDLVALGTVGTRWGVGRLRPAERERVERALAAVGALGYAERRLARLSGGQQQRVAIAQALVDDPAILLLDEPLASLDVRNQHEIIDLVGRVHQERPVTTFIVAHDLNPLLSVVTAAVYLLDGHPHYGLIGDVVDSELLTHLYGTPMKVVRTAQGDLFTRGG